VVAPSLADASPADAFSTRLGKYDLIRRIATGGMAELFLARTTAMAGFEKLVVLKRILPAHAESEDFIRMFLAEARLAATLHHPNIVQVYDIGEERGTYFFTMEYVQGQDLRRIVRAARKANRALPLEHILHVIMGMAAGLNHAHEKVGHDGLPLGIVHRDVSPSNVLVTYEGSVKIVDFGIAKAARVHTATIAGTLKGKIPYMSPEQCRGEKVDRRSDVFSIGTLMWELTTGRRLFASDNEFVMMNRVASGEVPLPSSVRPDYPPELEQIVMKALQADPDQRYASALELQVDLEDFARDARLPVSSARMAKFMRELFTEEMSQAARELTVDRTAVTRAEPGDTQPVVVETPDSGDANNGTPTPGVVYEDSVSGVGTEVGGREETDIHVPKRRPGVLAVLAGGVVAAVAITGFAMVGSDSTTTDQEKAGPVEVLEAPPVELDPNDASEPVDPPTPVEEVEALVDERDDESVDEAPDEVAEVEEAGPEVSEEPETSTVEAKSAKKAVQPQRREPRSKPKPAPSPSPKPSKKPKWDPDAALPPGL
jgi:serine/threonine protein kinase